MGLSHRTPAVTAPRVTREPPARDEDDESNAAAAEEVTRERSSAPPSEPDDPGAGLPPTLAAAARSRSVREQGLVLEPETWDGTDEVVYDELGAPRTREVSGTNGPSAPGSADAPAGSTEIVGERTVARQLTEHGDPIVTETVDQSVTERRSGLLSGSTEETATRGARVLELDGPAMARELAPQLEQRLDGLDEADPERARIRADLERLEAQDVDVDTVRAVRDRWGGQVRQHLRSAEEDTTTRTRRQTYELGRRSTEERTVRQQVLDGIEQREERSEGATTDLRTLSHERSVGTVDETVDRETGRAERRETTGTGGVSVLEEGGPRIRATSGERVERREGDEVVEAREQRVSVSRGATWTEEDGWGYTRSGSAEEERTADGLTQATSVSRSTTIQANRVATEGAASAAQRAGHLETTQRVAGDGSFRIDLQPVEDADPPHYLMTFSIHVGASGSLGTGTRTDDEVERRATGRVEARAEGSADLVVTRRLTPEEAQRYLDEADRRDAGGGGSSGLPGFDRLDRLIAAGDNADALVNTGAVLGGASTARGMQDGEAVELDLTGTVGVDGSVQLGNDAQSVGLSGGASGTWRRQARVERVQTLGRDLVRIEVTFTDMRQWNAGASVAADGVGVGGTQRGGEGTSERVQVELDPNDPAYDDLYARVLGATGPDALRRIASEQDLRDRITERDSTTEESDGGTLSVSGGPLGMGVGEGHRHSETERVRDGEVSREIVGEHQASLDASVGGVQVVDYDQTTTATASADAEGVDLDVQSDEAVNDPLQTASNALTAARGRDASENAGRALNALSNLRAQLTEQHHRLSGMRVSPAHTERLVQRAGDATLWNRCGVGLDASLAWRTLGGTLRSVGAPPDDEARRLQRNIRIARALADFVEQHGDRARATIQNALRRYGDDGRAGTNQRAGQRLGLEYEWPPAIQRHRATYTRLRDEVERIDRAADELLRDRGAREAEAMFTRVESSIDDIRGRVEGCGDFESPTAKSELIADMHHQVHLVQRARARFTARVRGEGDVGANLGDDSEDLPGHQRDVLERQRIQGMLSLLRANKRTERGLLDEMREELHSFFQHLDVVYTKAGQVHDLHLSWYDQIRRLRLIYRRVGVPEEEWEVSTGPNQPRTELEPDVARLRRYYLSAANRDATPPTSFQEVAAEWRREYRSY